jgi:hypothetical protein
LHRNNPNFSPPGPRLLRLIKNQWNGLALTSIANELSKLAKLRDQGVITEAICKDEMYSNRWNADGARTTSSISDNTGFFIRFSIISEKLTYNTICSISDYKYF